MKQFSLKVEAREGAGRGPAHRLRVAGKVPAVVYGKGGSRLLQIDEREFRKLWKEVVGLTAIIEIHQEGQPTALSIIQEVQRHRLKDTFTHVDLHEVAADEKFATDVAVHVVGDAFGVRNEGAILNVQSHRIHVRALPRDLPANIDVDVTELKAGQAIHLRDVKPIAGVEYVGHPDTVIVACALPKAAEAELNAAATAEPAAAAADPKVAAAKPGDGKAAAPAKAPAKK